MRFSMVRPSIRFRTMLPLAISSASSVSSTFTAWAMMMEPIPSPSMIPMVTTGLLEKSTFVESMCSMRASCSSSSVRKASQA